MATASLRERSGGTNKTGYKRKDLDRLILDRMVALRQKRSGKILVWQEYGDRIYVLQQTPGRVK